MAGEGPSRLRELRVWRLNSGGRGPLCAQGMGKLRLAGHTWGCRSQRVQDLARLVREGAVDRSVGARPRKGLGFTWGGTDGSGTLEGERELWRPHCLRLPPSCPCSDPRGHKQP